MPKLAMKGNSDASLLAQEIKSALAAAKCNLLNEVSHEYGSYRLYMLTFQKQYGRSSNKQDCTVLVAGTKELCTVDAYLPDPVNTGLIPFSWGMDEDFVCILSALLKKHGFE